MLQHVEFSETANYTYFWGQKNAWLAFLGNCMSGAQLKEYRDNAYTIQE